MAESEHVADRHDLLDAGGVAELVEVGVAGNLDGVLEREFAVGAFFFRDPAAHVFVAVLHAAVAGEGFFIQPGTQTREGDGDFVSRARRVGADGSVDHRVGLVLVDLVPIAGGDRGDENIRVVGGNRGHGKDVPIARIENHRSSAADHAQSFLGDALYFGINGQVDIVALNGLPTTCFALDDALGIAAEDASAGLAFELLVQEKLDLGFSLHIGLVKIERSEVGEFV